MPPPTAAPGTPPLLEVQDLVKRFATGTLAVDDVSFRSRPARALGPGRRIGLGQEHDRRGMVCRLIDPSEGDIALRRRNRSATRPGARLPPLAAAPGHPDRVPGSERQPQPALHRLRLHRPSAAPARRPADGCRAAAARARMRRARRPADRAAGALPAPAFRRAEGARRHRPRHRLPAAAAGARRADRGARRLGAGRGAATARPAAARG